MWMWVFADGVPCQSSSSGKICNRSPDLLLQLACVVLPGRNRSPDLGVSFPSALHQELLAPENEMHQSSCFTKLFI